MALSIHLTIRVARGHAQQQAALDAWLDRRFKQAQPADHVAAVIAEGAVLPLSAPPTVAIERIAAGCVCCVGSTALRVTLVRLVRSRRPHHILLLIATSDHEQRVRRMLRSGQMGIDFVEDEPDADR